ncbi:MAG: DoxX family protein [Pseudomonadota bacterium]
MSASTSPTSSKFLPLGLWAAQVVVAFLFVASGLTKLLLPIADLTRMMVWPGEFPVAFVHTVGLVDLAGGLGILLPSLTRIYPRVAVWAALGCVVLQVLAIGFHGSRGELVALPLNLVLLPLAIFVLWGRGKRLPIRARG